MVINFLDQVDIMMLKKEHAIEQYEFVNISIGNDFRIYLLYSSKIPQRVQNGSFVQTTSGSDYKAIVLTVDWECGGLLHHHLLAFGRLEPNVHILEPISNNYLLLGCRAQRFKDGRTENNALILSENGVIVNSMCLGDGIENCMVDYENNIVASYFDEGVFGNYGWGGGAEPLGSHGIVKWSQSDQKLWEDNNHGIRDCYAINIDSNNRLWFYYYTEFNLVRTDYLTEQVYTPEIRGSAGFFIRSDFGKIVFDRGFATYRLPP